jgi:hypothetical protein
MTPMRAIIVGPPLLSATRIKTSTAVCHSSICCSAFGSFWIYLAASNAASTALDPYFIALGRVAHAWNHLHEDLGKVFCAVSHLELDIGMAIWHGLKSDRSQRDILLAAAKASDQNEDWSKQHPGASDGIIDLLNKTNALADHRNNAIHAPCSVAITSDGTDLEIVPVTFFGNDKAKRLRGKFEWYEKSADVLRIHAVECRFALDMKFSSWPEKPLMPTRGQDHSLG